MKIPKNIKIYGSLDFRDKKCPKESVEQMTFVNRVRKKFPSSYGRILIHAKNEAKLKDGQFQAINKDKAMGMSVGASDIIIPGSPSFVCELKRRDHTLCDISEDQIDYLIISRVCGAFACIALGCDAAGEAFEDYLKMQSK